MKNIYIYIVIFLFPLIVVAQKQQMLNVDVFYGMVVEHDKSLKTAIQGNPFGLMVAYNFKNATKTDKLAYYNYPDVGFSTLYQNTNSDILGEMVGLYSHYNFYLNNRNALNKLQFRLALGLGYITNPYHEITNEFNYTLATKMAGSAYFKLNYQRKFLNKRWRFQMGVSLIHFSNAGFKNPNLGINTLVGTLGLNYNFDDEVIVYPVKKKPLKESNIMRYNFLIRTGLNESKIPDSGQFPFYVATFSMEKKLNYKSTITGGVDYFKSEFLKNYLQDKIELETRIPNNTQFKTDRIGIFLGHELKLPHVAVVTQLAYNVYYPNKYISRVYERLGLKHRFNDHLFTELTLKVNLFRAEGLEFGFGYRF